mgnify:CR=1 FL=1
MCEWLCCATCSRCSLLLFLVPGLWWPTMATLSWPNPLACSEAAACSGLSFLGGAFLVLALYRLHDSDIVPRTC